MKCNLLSIHAGVTLLLRALWFSCNSPQTPRLNIILVIGDDHGHPYFGFIGNDQVCTLNLDTFANQGTVCHLGHEISNPCRPSLQALITRLYPAQYAREVGTRRAYYALNDSVHLAASNSERAQLLDVLFRGLAMEHINTLP